MFHVEGVYWVPTGAGACGTKRPARPAAEPEQPAAEGYQATQDGGGGEPESVDRPTLVIWHSQHCASCKLNAPLFDRLERRAVSARTGVQYVVRRVQWKPEHMVRFGHVLALPMYDLVDLAGGGGETCYGPGTVLRSIRNDAREPLEAEFPDAFAS